MVWIMNKTFIDTGDLIISFNKINGIKYLGKFMDDFHNIERSARLCIYTNSENFTISANSYEDESNIKEIYNNYKEYLLNKEGIKI